MTTSREAILGRIRRNISPDVDDATRRSAVAERLANPPRGILPAADPSKAVEKFVARAKAAAASVDTVARADIGKAVSAFLRDHNLPQRLRMGADARLQAITWPKGSEPEIVKGPSDGHDEAGLSHAFAGAAETGTLVLLSGADNPSTVNFLPENHIVVVDSADITDAYEAVWTRLREKIGPGKMPRTVNMVTGPSRSADIEQTLIMGAHGPVRLHVIVVTD